MSQAIKFEDSAAAERAELERLRTALEASGDVVYEWRLTSDAIEWSTNARQAFGLNESIDISTHANFLTRICSEDLPGLTRPHDDHVTGGESFLAEYRVRRSDGEFCWVQDRGVVRASARGRPDRVIGVIRVVTPNKKREAQLERLASYDELTGHYNRTRLRESLDHALAYADRYAAPGAYIVIAIDDLATIGDAYGHDAADSAVIAVGRALDRCLRESDIIGRVAPDRFGVIVSGCREQDLGATAEKIRADVQRAFVGTPAGPISLTASIGGVTFPHTVRTPHDAMSKADFAVELARRAGHNRFVPYNLTEAQRSDHRRTLAIAKQIQTALQTNRLEFAFQPIVGGRDHEVRFYECLLRMRDADSNVTAAGAFLPVAEERGLVGQIDQRALEMAVAELLASPDVCLAINVSGLTTTDPAWQRNLIALVKGRPDIARRLVIEITETAAIHDMEETIRFVTTVRDVGCRVALDDFGAGYTSFRHLKSMAVDIIKIDGSFITDIVDRPEDFLFVKTLQVLAAGFGLKTVAECVETEDVAKLLAGEGIDYLQGYYFGKPSFDRPWLRSEAPLLQAATVA